MKRLMLLASLFAVILLFGWPHGTVFAAGDGGADKAKLTNDVVPPAEAVTSYVSKECPFLDMDQPKFMSIDIPRPIHAGACPEIALAAVDQISVDGAVPAHPKHITYLLETVWVPGTNLHEYVSNPQSLIRYSYAMARRSTLEVRAFSPGTIPQFTSFSDMPT